MRAFSNSLWVADALCVFLKLDMPITLVDAVFDEITCATDIGRAECEK